MGEIAASQELAKKGPADIVAGYLDDFAMVLPQHVRPETFVRLGQGLLRQRPELAEAAIASPSSLVATLFECARLGHDPGTDQYAITARKVKGVPTIVGIEQYQGVVERMYRAGAVKSVHADVVRKNDRYVSPDPSQGRLLPVHQFDPFASEEDRGPLVGVYAFAQMDDSAWSRVIWMPKWEVEKHKKLANTMAFWEGPFEAAMWIKTAVHALEVWVPTSAEYRREIARVNAAAAVIAPPTTVDTGTIEGTYTEGT